MRGPKDRLDLRKRIPEYLKCRYSFSIIDKDWKQNRFNPQHKKYLIRLEYGWKALSETPHYHFIYCNTLHELIKELKTAEPCECGECKRALLLRTREVLK